MSALHTPAQRAESALNDSRQFCNLLASARQHKVSGWWDGSAFRSHPCGLVVGTIKLTNHWHVDDLCTVEITDGSGWDVAGVSRDSFSHRSAHPAPIGGAAVRAWYCGTWASPEMEAALRPRLLQILTAAAEQIELIEATRRTACEQQREILRAASAATVSVALAKATGAAA